MRVQSKAYCIFLIYFIVLGRLWAKATWNGIVLSVCPMSICDRHEGLVTDFLVYDDFESFDLERLFLACRRLSGQGQSHSSKMQSMII